MDNFNESNFLDLINSLIKNPDGVRKGEGISPSMGTLN